MPTSYWSKSYALDRPLGITGSSLRVLSSLLIAAGCEKVFVTLSLCNGETRTFEGNDDLEQLTAASTLETDLVLISGRFDAGSIEISLSRQSSQRSYITIGSSNENKMLSLRGAIDTFEETYAAPPMIGVARFVTLGKKELLASLRTGTDFSASSDTDRSEGVSSPTLRAEDLLGSNSPASGEIVRTEAEVERSKVGDLSGKVLSKTIRYTPSALPHAKLYLDDLKEIALILLQAYEAKKRDWEPPSPSLTRSATNSSLHWRT